MVPNRNRVLQNVDLFATNLTNIEAAHGRIMDTDVALNPPGLPGIIFLFRQVPR